MTIQEMRSWFDMIQDKFNSPYFTDVEFEEFINQGQINFVNETIFGSPESTDQITEVIRPLIIQDLPIASNSNGDISNTLINTAIDSRLTATNQEYIHLLSVALDPSGYPYDGNEILCRFVRHNDFYKFNENHFKRPTDNNPIYRLSNSGIMVSPPGIKSYSISVVKKPNDVSLSEPVSHCELPSVYHNIVVSYAIQLASVASRDEALSVMLNSNKTNSI